MRNLDIITTKDMYRWDEVLDEVGAYDFHHLSSYHRLAELRGEGTANMIVYREGGVTIAFPFLVREVDLPVLGSNLQGYLDVTSVHGYPGPLASNSVVPEGIRQGFLSVMSDYFEMNGIIAAFTRFHPLLKNNYIVEDCGETVDIGVTVSIDLTVPLETQVANYRKSNRYEIGRLKKMGLTCFEVGLDHLDEFLSIYHGTMDRVGADQGYYYDRAYVEYLLDDMGDTIHLFVCKDGDTTACVGLFGLCKGIMQYHLAGTADDYLKLAPMKLMLDTVREWGNERGAHTFHLGGGVGAQRDSLYNFKMGFGSREHTFSGWKFIADESIYEEICNEVEFRTGQNPECSYFPAYRDPCFNWQSAEPAKVEEGVTQGR